MALISSTTAIVASLAVLSFFLGFALGWVAATRTNAKSTRAKTKALVGVAVTIVWVTATIADIFVTGYTVSPLLHGLMGAIVGYFFTENGIDLSFGRGKE